MTAFNNTQAEKEHTLEDDVSEPWSSSPDAQEKRHFSKRSCNEEDFRSVQEKDTSSGCHCSERLPHILMSKQEVLCFLNHELEQERIAAESAANEAISMILRLQVEKAALQMEARHYQQVLEARTLYDGETISQLQAIISSQEADRLVLEQEIDECRQMLHKYSEIVIEKGCIGCDVSARAAAVPRCTQKTLHTMPSLGSGGSLRPLSLEEKFNYVAMQMMEDAQQSELSSRETRDEAKTKYVISMSTSDPTLNVDSENSAAVEALVMTHGAYLRMCDWQQGSSKLQNVKVDSQGKCLDDALKDCWLSILMQLSKLYKKFLKMEALGISGFEGDCRLGKCHKCSSDFRNGITQMQQKFPVDHAEYGQMVDCSPDAFQKEDYILSQNLSPQNLECGVEMLPRMWDLCWDKNNCKPFHQQGKVDDPQVHTHLDSSCDIMAIMESCVMNLAEKFAACQSRFRALEATRIAMTHALEATKENMRKVDKVLVIVANMMKDFLSFLGLGCDILDLLHSLMTHLTTVVKLVEDAKYAETYLSSKINTCVMKQDYTLAADREEPETVSSIQDDSDLLQETDCKMSKLAFLWSSSLEWMSNEKCRAETAFSGWDHI